MPCRGPFHRPAMMSASACFAAASADSSRTRIWLCNSPSSFFIRAIYAAVNSTGESVLARIFLAASAMVRKCKYVTISIHILFGPPIAEQAPYQKGRYCPPCRSRSGVIPPQPKNGWPVRRTTAPVCRAPVNSPGYRQPSENDFPPARRPCWRTGRIRRAAGFRSR